MLTVALPALAISMAFLDETPSGYADRTCELLDQILESGSQASARERLEAVPSELEEKAPEALEGLEDGFFDVALLNTYRRRLRTTSLERPIQEIRRREKGSASSRAGRRPSG